MLDLFTIFSKGGIVLWYFQGTTQAFTSSVNALIKSVILQERGGAEHFNHEALTLRYKLDNEFELVFVVAYQKILQLSYVDKLLTDIQIKFRNKYKDDLQQGHIARNFNDFTEVFEQMLKSAESAHKQAAKAPRVMKRYEESAKSQKTVSSMIVKGKEGNTSKTGKKKAKQPVLESPQDTTPEKPSPPVAPPSVNGELDEETIQRNKERKFGKPGKKPLKEKIKAADVPKKKGPKEKRIWDNGGTTKDAKVLDFSRAGDGELLATGITGENINEDDRKLIGQMAGQLKDMEPEVSSEEEEEEDEEDEEEEEADESGSPEAKPQKSSGLGFGFLSGLKSLVGSKTLSQTDIQPTLDKMRDHLIAKNVAADIADKLCGSVAKKLEGKVLGTFNTVTSTVKTAVREACVQILSPRRRVDILRDVMEAKQQKRPYTITFCGVNGVGKSTNLAKVAFWLVENGFRVLIAACDTFRAGAVEQLRTHKRKLEALHPAEAHGGAPMIRLYEKGYGKDPAGIAMEAINSARDLRMDVVLIDTAGRMQDNEPLMRALAKLIKVNQPDLVLFVGEALVGNEAVDQLTKFNQALADHSMTDNPRLIDGILLTKFDTIDDKVGAAISMTYITGQPIVFVGTGQTYTDLKNLNTGAVVHALLKN